MKKRTFLIIMIMAVIAGFMEAIHPGSGVLTLGMAGFYADPNIGYGKIPTNHPMNHTVYRSVEAGPIPFGFGVMPGTNTQTQIKLFNQVTNKLTGIAANYEGLAIEGTYSTLEGADVIESGIVNVRVLEAVDPSNTVRIRHIGAGQSSSTSGQTVDMNTVAGADATGLLNDETEYSESIRIGADTQVILVQGKDAQIYTTLLAAINMNLAGAVITISAGDLLITANVTGTGHETSVMPGGNLFSGLTQFIRVLAPVNGVDAIAAPETVGAFCTTADAGKTGVVVGAEFRGTTTGPGMVALFLPAGNKPITADV